MDKKGPTIIKEKIEIICIICLIKCEKSCSRKNIKDTVISSSQNDVKTTLLQFLQLQCITEHINLDDSSFVCTSCYKKIVQYDKAIVQLQKVQNELIEIIKSSNNKFTKGDHVNVFQIFENEPKSEPATGSDLENELSNGIKSDLNEMVAMSDAESPIDDIVKEEFNVEINLTSLNSENISDFNNDLDVNSEEKGKSKKSFRDYKKKIFANKRAKRCHICGVVRRDEEYLELHMNVHMGKTEKECNYCSKRYARPANVVRHMRTHWDEKKFQCEKCGLRFALDYLLYNHKLHHDAEEKPLVCSICNQSFKSKRTYNYHMTTHREDRPTFTCEICGKKFLEKYTLKVHLKKHANEEEGEPILKKKRKTLTEFVCIICGEQFGTNSLLSEHMSSLHDVINVLS